MNVREIKKLYYSSLSSFSDYATNNIDVEPYQFKKLPALSESFAEYDLCRIAGNGSTMQKARRIMQWIADNTEYDGGSPLPPSLPDKILQFAIGEKQSINCANRAILFADALVSLGIFAMPVWIEQKNGEFGHCHVIAQAWFPEMKCWGAFDPSFNTYFVYRGMPVSVPDMALLARKMQKYKAVSNESGYITRDGFLCTIIGLMDISVFPGNDYPYRYHWEERLHFVPESYIEHENLHLKTISINYLVREPSWYVD